MQAVHDNNRPPRTGAILCAIATSLIFLSCLGLLCGPISGAVVGTNDRPSLGTRNPHREGVSPFSLDLVRWAWAQSYCTGGSIDSSQAIAPNSISDQWADGCTLTAGVQLTLSGANMPNGESSVGSVAIRFASGTVHSQGIIVVQGPSSAAAQAMVPMVVLISGSTFLSGAAVKVTGSYPPYSNITIAHNTFTSQEHCPLLGVVGYFALCPTRRELHFRHRNSIHRYRSHCPHGGS